MQKLIIPFSPSSFDIYIRPIKKFSMIYYPTSSDRNKRWLRKILLPLTLTIYEKLERIRFFLVIDKCNINEPLQDQLDSSQCYNFDKSAIKKNDQWTARKVHLPSNLM